MSRTDSQRVVDSYATNNAVAARVILEDVERYGGETAGLVIWARMVLAAQAKWELVA